MTPFSLEEIERGTRYHEAGHAVAAYYHGHLITRVTVTDEESITTYRYPGVNSWADLWVEACITMAGPFAEQRALWGEMRPETWGEFLSEAEAQLELIDEGEDWLRGADHGDLLLLIRQMVNDAIMGAEPEESYRIVVRASRRLVTRLWAEIDAVARALEENDTLDGLEAVQIIERTTEERLKLSSLGRRLFA